ncbi:MAG: HRDC domain-containing protein [Gemmatimonadota bacterium]
MTVIHVADPRTGEEVAGVLENEVRIALDCEAAGFHRYSDRLCLLQLSTESTTYLIDPLAFDPSDVLRPALQRPGLEVIMHGADYDLRLLDRDLGIRLGGLFDTQAAAALLGEPGLGLSALLEKYLGITVSKKYQRADWAQRPLSDEMLDYAASDTRHLHDLADLLVARLEEAGRTDWAREESLRLEDIRWVESPEEDPVARFKELRELEPREVAALREALVWRDEVAREKDRAPFRIAGNPVLLEVVREHPRNVGELGRVSGFSPALAHSDGKDLLRRLDRIAALPDAELISAPPRVRNGPGRPLPEVEELAQRLKVVRNRRAEELGIDRGTVLSNGLLLEVAQRAPRDRAGLEAIPGIRKWQVEALGDGLLEVLNKG